jgi:hypothetical protein
MQKKLERLNIQRVTPFTEEYVVVEIILELFQLRSPTLTNIMQF